MFKAALAEYGEPLPILGTNALVSLPDPTYLWRGARRGRRYHEYGDHRFLGLLVLGRNAVLMAATLSQREVRKWEN